MTLTLSMCPSILFLPVWMMLLLPLLHRYWINVYLNIWLIKYFTLVIYIKQCSAFWSCFLWKNILTYMFGLVLWWLAELLSLLFLASILVSSLVIWFATPIWQECHVTCNKGRGGSNSTPLYRHLEKPTFSHPWIWVVNLWIPVLA